MRLPNRANSSAWEGRPHSAQYSVSELWAASIRNASVNCRDCSRAAAFKPVIRGLFFHKTIGILMKKGFRSLTVAILCRARESEADQRPRRPNRRPPPLGKLRGGARGA